MSGKRNWFFVVCFCAGMFICLFLLGGMIYSVKVGNTSWKGVLSLGVFIWLTREMYLSIYAEGGSEADSSAATQDKAEYH